MFVCRVLVGCYTRGQSNYRLPPSRDGGHILYDSCVNDGRDPSIFVVFDKQQVYPEFLITYTEHVYRSPVTVIDSDDSDYLLSPFKTTYTQLDSTQNLAVLTTKASAPQTVSVSSLTSSSSASPSPMVPSSSRGLPSSSGTVSVQVPSSLSLAPTVAAPSPPSVSIPTSSVSKPSFYTPSSKASDPNPAQAVSAARTTALSSPSQSSASFSTKQPSDPLQTAQSKSVSYSDDFGWDFIDIQSSPRRSLYSSSDASLTSSGVRSATQTSASTRRVSPPLLTTTKPSYSRPMTRARRQEDLYYVPSTARSTYEPKKKEECILL